MFSKIWNWIKGLFESKTPANVPPPALPRPIEIPVPQANQNWPKPYLMPFAIFHYELHIELVNYINNNPYLKLVNLELDQIKKEDIAFLIPKGIKVCAYISASYEKWRDDAEAYPASAKGKKMSGWDELWGNISDPKLVQFLISRFNQAKFLGCHFVEVDNVDIAFNDVGFKVTKEQNIAAIKELAKRAHEIGLGYFLKNTPELATNLVYDVDGVFAEEAFENEEEDSYNPFVRAQKPIFGLEYSGSLKAKAGWFTHLQKDYFDKSYKISYTGY
jgi:hypothetical protein